MANRKPLVINDGVKRILGSTDYLWAPGGLTVGDNSELTFLADVGFAAIVSSEVDTPLDFSIDGGIRFSFGPNGELLVGGTAAGSAGQILSSGGAGAPVAWSSVKTINSTSLLGSGNIAVGDVVGPASSVDGGLALFDGTTGKLLKSQAPFYILGDEYYDELIIASSGTKYTDLLVKYAEGPVLTYAYAEAASWGGSFTTRYADASNLFFITIQSDSTSNEIQWSFGDSLDFTQSGSVRFKMGPAGQFGIASSYGTANQVFISGGPSAAAAWSTLKTVNSTSLIGSGNVAVQPTLVSGTNIKTVNSTSLLGSGNLAVGDVVGPASSVNNTLPYMSGTTGKLIASSSKHQLIIDPDDNIYQFHVSTDTAAPGAGWSYISANRNASDYSEAWVEAHYNYSRFGAYVDDGVGMPYIEMSAQISGDLRLRIGGGDGYPIDISATSGWTNGFRIGTAGQLGVGVGSSAAYGTAGQAFVSGGPAAQPSWTSLKTVNSNSLLGSGNISVGDVTGPASSVDGELAFFDGTTGKLLKSQAPFYILGDSDYDELVLSTSGTKYIDFLVEYVEGTLRTEAYAEAASWGGSLSVRYSDNPNFRFLTLQTDDTSTDISWIAGEPLYFSQGGDVRFKLGPAAQIGVGISGNYGTANQVLISGGPSAAAAWSTIKTVNSTSLIGSGNVAVQATLVSGTNIKTVNSTSLLGSGNLAVGDVVGPVSSVDNEVVLLNGTTGKLIKSSGVLFSDLLRTGDVGVYVQAYDPDLTSWAGIAPSTKQDTLVSGTNIKTINGSSILGSGDLVVSGGGGGSGDVVGPASSVDYNIPAFNGTTGKLLRAPAGVSIGPSGGAIFLGNGATPNADLLLESQVSGGNYGSAEIYVSSSGPSFYLHAETSTAYITAAFEITATSVALMGDTELPFDFGLGSNIHFSIGTAGQLGLGASRAYGTSGHALLSGGPSAAPSWGAVQAPLVSGTSIKTVNSTSLLGSGNVAVQATLVSGTNIKTVNSTSLLGSGNVAVGDVVGPSSSVDNYVPLFSGATGKVIKAQTLMHFNPGTADDAIALSSPTKGVRFYMDGPGGTGSMYTYGLLTATLKCATFEIDAYGDTLAFGIRLDAGKIDGVNDQQRLNFLSGSPLDITVDYSTSPIFSLGIDGQFGIGASRNYGTSGQALLSGGASAAPSWGDTQAPLVSGTNIKTVNSTSLLGSGNIAIPVGDVVGPTSATDNGLAVFDGTTGKLLESPSSLRMSAAGDTLYVGYGVTSSGSIFLESQAVGDDYGYISIYTDTAGSSVQVTSETTGTSITAGLDVTPTKQQLGFDSSLPFDFVAGVPTGTVRFSIGPAGQWGIGASRNYGTANYALLSGGPSAAPSWGAVQDPLVSGMNIKTINSSSLLGSGNLAVGDVVGPASATTNEVALFDGTTGKLIKSSGVLFSDLLRTGDVGVYVQAYDPDLTSWAGIAPSSKQDTLVSATNIKTINGNSLLGSGDLVISGGPGGSGDVVGPSTATDLALARYDGTTGELLQDSKVTVSDEGTLVLLATSPSSNKVLDIRSTNTQANAFLYGAPTDADQATAAMFSFAMDQSGTTEDKIVATYGILSGTTANNRGGKWAVATKVNNGDTFVQRLSIDHVGAWDIQSQGVGTTGQVLTSQGAAAPPKWADPQIIVSATAPVSPSINQLWLDIS